MGEYWLLELRGAWAAATGQGACWTRAWLTEPSRRPRKPPSPRGPSTISAASFPALIIGPLPQTLAKSPNALPRRLSGIDAGRTAARAMTNVPGYDGHPEQR